MRERSSAAGLAAIAVGSTVRVTGVEAVEPERRLRLAEFGLRRGALITVLGRTPGDGRLVGLGTGRLALDARTAGCLAVEVA